MTCKVKGSAKVNDLYISWVRSADKNAKAATGGSVSSCRKYRYVRCVTTIPGALAPKNCLNETDAAATITKLECWYSIGHC